MIPSVIILSPISFWEKLPPHSCHPPAGGGLGDQTRSFHHAKQRSGYISYVALGPRLRGGDKDGGMARVYSGRGGKL
jgi:hypothetical protein